MDSTSTYEQKIQPMVQGGIFNPFPGLRPFRIDESHLFFGREGQSDEVLEKLAKNRFVAVIGASGSGKSSLMYCGLTPILHGGFLTETGSQWRIVVTRPGGGPINNLAEALVKAGSEKRQSDDDRYFRQAITSSVLRSSSLGLVDAIKQLHFDKEENILIMVDQFEELFRFKKSLKGTQSLNESLAFVRLLLEAVSQSEVPIYIILTMRSDFIGECAQFQDLTSLINDSHYLIPQMTRENFHKAIIGPAAVGGGDIAPRLVHQLLNDVGDNPDQLPIMQHALMRTWDYWMTHRRENEPMDIVHYEAVGRMEKALSLHANEAYDELDEQGKYIAEKLFKSLTEIGADNRGIRHPSPLKEIQAICDASMDDVINVINKFRQTGRSFLYPNFEVELTEDSIIDISHESLMRIWDRLISWVDGEASAIKMYLRLHEAAENYQTGKGGLWTPPDLHIATQWRISQNPTLAWALRHAPAFERTMKFLDISEREYQAEEQNKIKLQKRALRRSRITAMILGVAAILSLGFMLYALMAQVEAKRSEAKANIERINADKQKRIANLNAKIAAFEGEKALENERRANIQRVKAIRQTLISQLNANIASIESNNAFMQKQLAEEKKIEAEENAKIASEQRVIAYKASQRADTLRMLSISQSMAVKSLQISRDTTLRALVAYQSYLFNKQFGGNQHNPDIYSALYFSNKLLNNEHSDQVKKLHTASVQSLAYSPKENIYFSIGSEKKIIKHKSGSNNHDILLNPTDEIVKTLDASKEGDYLAAGTQGAKLIIYTITEETKKPAHIFTEPYHSAIRSVKYTKDNHILLTLNSYGKLVLWNLIEDNGAPKKLICKEDVFIKSFAISPDSKYVAGADEKGAVYIWELPGNGHLNDIKILKDTVVLERKELFDNDQVPVTSISYSNNGQSLAFGDQKGFVHVYNSNSKDKITLSGQSARISELEFSTDDILLASASFDGSILIWKTKNFNNQPVVLKDNKSWVWSISFSPDHSKLISGYQDGTIQEWPTNVKILANNILPDIKRNMTLKEWDRFVGSDIPPNKIVNKEWDTETKKRLKELESSFE